MVLGILSDTHLDEVDERLERLLQGPLAPAEVLLHAGDHTGPGVVDHLEFVDPRPYYGVAGNMDAREVRHRLPEHRVFELGGCRIGLVHGWGAPFGLSRRVLQVFPSPPDLVVFGHSHQPVDLEYQGIRIINPGSAMARRWTRGCTVALVEVEAGNIGPVRFVEVEG